MQAHRVALVFPYDGGETCAMACGLAGLLDTTPLRVSLIASHSEMDDGSGEAEFNFRYDRRLTFGMFPLRQSASAARSLWSDLQTVIWFCPDAFNDFCAVHGCRSLREMPKKHVLVLDGGVDYDDQLRQQCADLPGDKAIVYVTLSDRRLQSVRYNFHLSLREHWLCWDGCWPFQQKRPRRTLKLLVLAGVRAQDDWAMRYSRAGEQIAIWMQRLPDLVCHIVSAAVGEQSGWMDVTPEHWARLRNAWPDRVTIELRTLSLDRRTELYREADIVWNLSPHYSGLWDLEASASGCAILISADEKRSLLSCLLKPCCAVLPSADEWLQPNGQKYDEAAWQAVWGLCQEWRQLPCPWSRPLLEKQRRSFQTFWRQQLGLDVDGDPIWDEHGRWKVATEAWELCRKASPARV